MFGRVLVAILKKFGGSQQTTVTDGAVKQEIRLIASPNSLVIPANVTVRLNEDSALLSALISDVMLLLERLPDSSVEIQSNTNGAPERVIHLDAHIPEARLTQVVESQRKALTFPALIAGRQGSQSDLSITAPQRIDGQRHARVTLEQVLREDI